MAAFGRPEYDRYVRLAEMMISFLDNARILAHFRIPALT